MKETLSISGALFVLTAVFQTSSANPVGGNITVGSGTITQNGDILSVVTGSNRTVIDWDSFSIGTNQLTQIMQPGANSATLNRVVGTLPSELLGTLVSNGKVALINENGILVGNTGIIDTHGFIGSTLNTTNEAFLANGSLVFSGSSEATIVNKGAILAREGDVFLLGRNVTNEGKIEAQNGNAGLAAGGEIVLRKAGDEHVYVEVKSSSRGDKVVNSGTIKAIQDDLHKNGGNPYSYAMNTGHTGVNQIQVRPGGGVYLNAGTEGSVEHSGTIQAVKGAKGGEVALTGRTVDVKSGSTIDASGAKGGGTVKVGGGFKGKDKGVTNSQITRVQEGATIKADATESGNGGKVVVWSDGKTIYHGDISAKGAGTGRGGDAEVSGKGNLDFQGKVDLTAASGQKGSLLLDPKNITIQDSNPDIDGNGTPGDDIATTGDLDDAIADQPGADSIITAGQVSNLLILSDLKLAATNDIHVEAAIAQVLGGKLTLEAGHDIEVNAAIDTPGGIALTAGNDIKVGAALTSLGDINLVADRDINVSAAILSNGGDVSLNFGQSGTGGALNFLSGGSASAPSLLHSATATGGAGDDSVSFNAAFGAGNEISINLGAGTNTINLTTGDDAVSVTGANEISFGSSSITGVSAVDGLGGANSVTLTTGDDTFSVTGANAGSASGIAFSAVSAVDGNGGTDTFVNSTGAAFDGVAGSVSGVTATDFDTVDTAALNLSTGDDTFVVSGAGAGTFGGQAYTGLTTVDALGGTNGVTLTAGDDTFTATGANAGSTSGIAFTGISSANGNGGTDTFVNSTGSAFDGGTVSVGGITATNFDTVNTAALNLTTGNDTFVVTGADAGTFGTQAYTGLTTVDALAGTNGVTLTAGNDTFTATGANAGSTSGIAFTGISSANGNGGTDTFVNSTGSAFNGGTVSVGGITATDFDTIDTAALTLTAGDDTFNQTGSNTGTFNGQAYTGVTSVDGLGGANFLNDTVFGHFYDAGTSSISGIGITNFQSIHVMELLLTAGNDTFTATGMGTGTFNGLNFSGLLGVDGGGGTDTLVNQTGEAIMLASISPGGMSANSFEIINTPDVILSDADDNFLLDGSGTAVMSPLLTLTGLQHVDLGNGNNTVTLAAGINAFSVTGTNAGSGGGLTFTHLNSVVGSGAGATLSNTSGVAYDGATNSIASVAQSGFGTVDTPLLNLTAGGDSFTVTGSGTGTFGGQNFTGLTMVDGLGGSDAFVNGTASAFNGATTSVAGVTAANFETVNTALLNLTTGSDSFTVTGAGAGTFGALNFTGLTTVDGLGGSDTFLNGTALAFDGATTSVSGVTASNFETVNTALLNLTTGSDTFTVAGAGAGTFGALNFTGLTTVDGLGGSDTFVNGTALAFDGATTSVSGVTAANFETVNTALLNLTIGADTFTVTGAGAGTFGTLNFTGLTTVDGLGDNDTFVNGTALAFNGATTSVSGVTASNFETVNTALLNLTTGSDNFTVNGAGTGTFGALNFTGLTTVDGLGGSDTFINGTALAFDGATNSVSGVTAANFETVNTALLILTTGSDTFTVTGAGAGTFGTLNFTGLTTVDGLGASDTFVNGTSLAFDGATNSVSGVTAANFETVNTALLNLTIGDDTFTATGAGAGTFGTLIFTGLTNVDALGGADTFVNNSGSSYSAETSSVAGINTAGFETIQTAALALTAGSDIFTVTGSSTGTFGGQTFTGLATVDGLGGSDTLVNGTALAFDGATNSVSGVTISNFETVNTSLLNLTTGADVFTVTGANAGTFGALNFTGLTSVDGLGGSDTLVNSTALAFDGGAKSVSGVAAVNFETVNTALLNLTTGDDTFALNGSGTGSFNGLDYTGLTNVDGLAGSNTVLLTAGGDTFTVTGSRAGTGSGVGFTNLDTVDGSGGSDTLVNSTLLAFDGSTNSIAGVTGTNFETIDTAKLNLTAGDDTFTVTGSNTGTFGALNFIHLNNVDGLGGSDTLVNNTSGAFDGATNTVAGITQANFETVSTSLLTLTTGDDTFTVTGANAGTFGPLQFVNLSQVDALGGTDTIVLTGGNDSLTVTGSGAITTAGFALSNLENVDGAGGFNAVTLTAGDDLFTATGSRAGTSLAINFSNIDSVDGGGGTNTYVGTVGADAWTVSSSNAGALLGVNFNGFSQLRTGGSVLDTFDFQTGGDITGSIAGTDAAGSGLAAVGFSNNGVATTLSGSVRSDGLRLTSTNGGSFTLLNSSNNVGIVAANLDGALNFSNGSAYTVGTVAGTTGITTTGDAVTLDSTTGEITLAANVSTGDTTAGDVTFNRDVLLTSNEVITGGKVVFGGKVDGGGKELLVNSGGDTIFTGTVGGSAALARLETDGGGTTRINGGSVLTTGVQIFGDSVTLGAPVSVFASGSSVTFAASLDGASATTVNAVSTLFGGAVGGGVALTSLTSVGTTQINGNLITTTGAQLYQGDVTLGSAVSVFNGAAVTFDSKLDGASDVTINALATTFGGEVGGVANLNNLTTDAGGTVTIAGPAVRTAGTQTYGDDVILTGGSTIFSGGGVTFGAKLDGASAVAIQSSGVTRFRGAVGGGTALTSLTTDAPGSTVIEGGLIATTGSQSYLDPISLASATTKLTGAGGGVSGLSFASIDGYQDNPMGGAQLHNDLTIADFETTSLGNVKVGTLTFDVGTGSVKQTAAENTVAADRLTGESGETILFNANNDIASVGNYHASGNLLIRTAHDGIPTSGPVNLSNDFGFTVAGNVKGDKSVWLVSTGNGRGLHVSTGTVTATGSGNTLLLVGGTNPGGGVSGTGELVIDQATDPNGSRLTVLDGASAVLIMNSLAAPNGSYLRGLNRSFLESLNFSFSPGDNFNQSLSDVVDSGDVSTGSLKPIIENALPGNALGLLSAAIVQDANIQTDSASQISDIVALVRGFFNDLETTDEKVTNDASAIVEIGKMARFESGVYPPAYGPFALTSYEYQWWLQERDGKVKDKDLFYNKRYPLYLKQKGSGANGRPNYESILEER